MNSIPARLCRLLAILFVCLVAVEHPSRAQEVAASNNSGQPVRMDVFLRGDSEISEAAKVYAEKLGARTQGLEVAFHDVLQDRDQLSRLWTLAKQSGRDKPVVPAFLCCGQMYYGFTSEQENGASIENLFTVDVYTRSTCPRCRSAKAFIASTLQPRWPALRFRIYEITTDAAARRRYEELCRSQGKVPGLPTLHFAGQVMIGYQGDQITGAQWTRLIERVAAIP